ncbi:adenine deaminase [Periweissella fabalis]|uniref:Adenine deaminase n=1 Tax=Periweissella fabalis TaxID=1070421 RepID=A0A7X6N4U7_9LACO|nr:adenine deaminase [Periweissella fabalis]MCM0599613.1 adenine deaminase [Periweissella fabalis]NKZ23918.1 adenine deaminase [Periweissella fabalis]
MPAETITVDQKIINAQILDVFNQAFISTTVWILADRVYALGEQPNLVAQQTFDANGKTIVPGFIDAHMHIESSLLNPVEFGKLAIKRGITTVFADPHEIANVQGTDGLDYFLAEGLKSPIDIQFMLPSSVPAVNFENAGAKLTAADLKPYYQQPNVGGLAEVMDFPALANADADMLTKIADAQAAGKQIDGHTAGLQGAQLNIYRKYGIATDHEARTANEALERVAAGFYVYLREGTVERDLEKLLPAVTANNYHRFAFCTDDKTVVDMVTEGGVDYNIQKAIALGMYPAMAYTLASFNGAQSHAINDLGAIAPGFKADLVVLEDVESVAINRVMKAGVWQNESNSQATHWPYTSMNYTIGDLTLPIATGRARVIGIIPDHIDTEHLILDVPTENGNFIADFDQDLAKIVVIERHNNLPNTGVGIVKGFQFKAGQHGAIASSVAHDSHNLIAAGTDDHLITKAIDAIGTIGGGFAVVNAAGEVTCLPLPIGGLVSSDSYQNVWQQYHGILGAFNQISTAEFDPFITLSFLALPVIPALKITDQGLFDFDTFSFVSCEV